MVEGAILVFILPTHQSLIVEKKRIQVGVECRLQSNLQVGGVLKVGVEVLHFKIHSANLCHDLTLSIFKLFRLS